jgi:hypothetical protein
MLSEAARCSRLVSLGLDLELHEEKQVDQVVCLLLGTSKTLTHLDLSQITHRDKRHRDNAQITRMLEGLVTDGPCALRRLSLRLRFRVVLPGATQQGTGPHLGWQQLGHSLRSMPLVEDLALTLVATNLCCVNPARAWLAFHQGCDHLSVLLGTKNKEHAENKEPVLSARLSWLTLGIDVRPASFLVWLPVSSLLSNSGEVWSFPNLTRLTFVFPMGRDPPYSLYFCFPAIHAPNLRRLDCDVLVHEFGQVQVRHPKLEVFPSCDDSWPRNPVASLVAVLNELHSVPGSCVPMTPSAWSSSIRDFGGCRFRYSRAPELLGLATQFAGLRTVHLVVQASVKVELVNDLRLVLLPNLPYLEVLDVKLTRSLSFQEAFERTWSWSAGQVEDAPTARGSCLQVPELLHSSLTTINLEVCSRLLLTGLLVPHLAVLSLGKKGLGLGLVWVDSPGPLTSVLRSASSSLTKCDLYLESSVLLPTQLFPESSSLKRASKTTRNTLSDAASSSSSSSSSLCRQPAPPQCLDHLETGLPVHHRCENHLEVTFGPSCGDVVEPFLYYFHGRIIDLALDMFPKHRLAEWAVFMAPSSAVVKITLSHCPGWFELKKWFAVHPRLCAFACDEVASTTMGELKQAGWRKQKSDGTDPDEIETWTKGSRRAC